MISAKDLRAHNYLRLFLGVGDNGPEYRDIQIDGIFIDQYGVGHWLHKNTWIQISDNLQPIPLTEEWLDNKIECTKIENKGYPSYNVNGLLINFIDGVWIEYVSRIEIKGIHHLQNIIYFRTNQELTIG